MWIGWVTSIVAACSLALMLKGLHLFHLIDWSPVGFTKKWGIEGLATFEKWLILIVVLFLVAIVLYYIFSFLPLSASIMSILLGITIAILVEWTILRYPLEASSFKQLSIPFIVVVMMTLRFVIETATFARNNLVR